MDDFKEFLCVAGVGLALLTIILGPLLALCAWCGWISAGKQQAAWERQGIHMTRSEIFWGARPSESIIRVKQEPAND